MTDHLANYKASTSVIAQSGYYGGRMFVKYNSRTKRYYSGNTASTAVSEGNSAIIINDVRNKDLKDLIRQLKNLGYKEFTPNWKLKDTYGDINRKGL